jgi:hypothetical protein
MSLGLSVFRSVKALDPDLARRIHALESTGAYRDRGIIGLVQMPRETFVNIALPFEYEINETLNDSTTGYAVLGPGGEIVARAKTIAEAEDIAANAKITMDVRVTRGKADDGALPS